jgi:hypothetical protein
MRNSLKLQGPSTNHQGSSKFQHPLLVFDDLDVLWSLDVGVWMFRPVPTARSAAKLTLAGKLTPKQTKSWPMRTEK